MPTFANYEALQEAAEAVGISLSDLICVPLGEGRKRCFYLGRRQTSVAIDRYAEEAREAIVRMVNEYLATPTVPTEEERWDWPEHRRFAFYIAATLAARS